MIKEHIIDGQDAITLELGDNSVTVIKSLGGTVYRLKLNGKELLYPDREEILTKNPLFRGRLLFPFNDRIPNGKYKFKGREFQFPINCDGKDSIHGLIYNRVMETVLVKEDNSSVELTLLAPITKNDFKGYPFDIALQVTYNLTKEYFNIDFKVSNKGDSESPFALGWHPYFTFGSKVDGYNLKFNGDEYYDVDENLYYEGNHYSVKGTDLDFSQGVNLKDRDLDVAISLKDRGEFLLTEGKEEIKMEFPKEMFPALQLFIPDDRESIAVEPITAPSDTFNYPDTGLKVIKPGEVIKGSVKLTRN